MKRFNQMTESSMTKTSGGVTVGGGLAGVAIALVGTSTLIATAVGDANGKL